MDSFIRTTSGLLNEHLFYSTDGVVYLEGGDRAYSYEEVIDDKKFHEETLDIIFWKNIFNIYYRQKSLKYKSTGSKTTVLKICNKIIESNLSTTYACMDNEFDELLSKRIEHKNIFYVYGYSWENEVWCIDSILNVINILTACEVEQIKVCDCFNDFLQKINIGVQADYHQFNLSSSFFERVKGRLWCIEMTTTVLPFVKTDLLQQRLVSKSININNLIYDLSSQKFCYGHLLADFGMTLILRYIKLNHRLDGVNKEIINRIIIKSHFDSFDNTSPLYSYYGQQFNRSV